MEKRSQDIHAIRFRMNPAIVWGFIMGWGTFQAFFILMVFEVLDDEGRLFFPSRPIAAVVIQCILLLIAFGIARGLYRAASLTLTPVGILFPGWFSTRFFRWDEIEGIEDPEQKSQPGPLLLKWRSGQGFIAGGQANSRAVARILQLYFEAAQRNISPQRLLNQRIPAESGMEREFLPDLEIHYYERDQYSGVTVSPESYGLFKWGSLVFGFCTFVIGFFVMPGSSLDLWIGWILVQLASVGIAVISHRQAKRLSTGYRVSPEGIEAFHTTAGRVEFLEWDKIVEFQDRAGNGMAKLIAEDGRSINLYYGTLDYFLLEGIIFQKTSRMRVTGKRWVVPTSIPKGHPDVTTLSIEETDMEKPSRLWSRSLT